MSSHNKKTRIDGRKVLILLMIVLAVLLALVLGLAFWLSHADNGPPKDTTQTTLDNSPHLSDGTEEPDGTEGSNGPDGTEGVGEGQNSSIPSSGPADDSTAEPTTKPTSGSASNPQKETQPANSVSVENGQITCSQYSLFSGQFAEDGKDELVTNVATILVTNNSDRFLDLATITYQIDGKEATFVVTGLPAGRSAWVMETSRMTATANSTFTYKGIVTAFRDNVVTSTSKITITADGNMLTATNNTGETIEGVFIYYRTMHTDGNFLGGITYLVDFGTLAPGQSVEKMGGHFSGDSEIVRIGWLTN